MTLDSCQPPENAPRVAYSYIRFSTPEQRKGTSFQRQFDNSTAYVKRRGLVLDTSLNLFDEGRSAFTGENREEGALSEFLAAIKAGKVRRGSVLVVENLDRLSRQEITTAYTLFIDILKAGVEIVTLGDNEQVYTEASVNSSFGQLIYSLSSFARGHEESAVKSQRLSAAWQHKRADVTQKLTAQAPAWLKLAPDRLRFEVIEERADLIKRIFELAANGVGHHRIAKTLNKESVPVWGRSKIWNSSYIMKLLSGRSVLGEFQPHQKPKGGKRVPIGEVLENYFPAIISPELFQKVNTGRIMRRDCGGRVGPQISNLFTHIAKCGYCGASMQYVQKGSGSNYLVCSAAKGGAGCQYMSWPYEHFERHFLKFVEELDYSELINDTSAEELKQRRARLEAADGKIAEIALKQRRLMDLVELGTVSDTGELGLRLRTLQTEETLAKQERITFSEAYEAARNQYQELKDNSEELVTLIKMNSDPETRQKLATEIRRKVTRIDVCPSGGLSRQDSKSLISVSDSDFDNWLASRKRDESEWHFCIFFVNGERRTVEPMLDGYKVHGSLPPSLRNDSCDLSPEEIDGWLSNE
jgi:DNA invertase Pin-like site-specific DNA recombinase